MKLTNVTKTGRLSKVKADPEVFTDSINWQLLSQAIRVYMFNQRQGTSRVKTRGEVRLTKSKWYRQKGTGRARHGAKSAPIFVGGGVTHGPTGLENWSRRLSRKMKLQALLFALRAQVDNLFLVEGINDLSSKTKDAAQLLAKFAKKRDKVLVIVPEGSVALHASFGNIEQVLLATAKQVNALDISSADVVAVTNKTLDLIKERLEPVLQTARNRKAVIKSAKVAQSTKTTKPAKSAKTTPTTKPKKATSSTKNQSKKKQPKKTSTSKASKSKVQTSKANKS